MRLHRIAGVIVIVGLLSQAAPADPVRLGFSGGRFTADDLAQIDLLAHEAGGSVWIVRGLAPPFLIGRWWAIIYLRPTQGGTGVRRGRAFYASAEIPSPDAYGVAKTWRRESVRDYAQVPEPGRDPDTFSGDRDFTTPFLLTGRIDDDKLISLVAAIRANPRLAGAPANVNRIFVVVEGSWPIESVAASPGAATVRLVGLDPREKQGQSVQLTATIEGWTVTRLASWIAD